jgi:hypothetical protein
MFSVYVLKCQNNKYFIGKTSKEEFSLENYFNSLGNRWTFLNEPIELLELIRNCDKFDEDKYTLKYMDKYGIENVRGGSWNKENLGDDEKEIIKKMLNNANNSENNNQENEYSYSYDNPSYSFPNKPTPKPRKNLNSNSNKKNTIEDISKEIGSALGKICNQIDNVGSSLFDGFMESFSNSNGH